MKLRIFSDIHNEFGRFHIKELEDDKNSILILAGDIGILEQPLTYERFLEECSERFKMVLIVFGNHEYYYGDIKKKYDICKNYNNVFKLDCNYAHIENGISFVGDTLWTNFLNSPIQEINAFKLLNDFKLIRNLNIDTIKFLNKIQKGYIFEQIKKMKLIGNKVVVISHHAPAVEFRDDNYDYSTAGGFVNDFYKEINESKPDIWISGHVHKAKDIMIGSTRCISNPVGYPDENTNYNSDLIIEI